MSQLAQGVQKRGIPLFDRVSIGKKAREGVHGQLLKVKFHIGIEGNEKADALVHEACKPEFCTDIASEGIEIREDIFWPHFSGRNIHSISGGAAAIVMNALGGEQPSQSDPNHEDTAGQFWVNDLRKGLEKILKAGCSKGFSKQDDLCTVMDGGKAAHQGEISKHFWASPQVTTPMVTMILKYRYGQLWNMKIAFRQQRPYFPGLRIPQSDKCPHCGQADSGGHIPGGCSVPAFKAMYIARHHQALRLILKSIAKGDHGDNGGYYTIADIGRAELIESMGVSAKRTPPWLLPGSCLERANIDPADKSRLRPDIMLVEMTQSESMSYRRHSQRHLELSRTMNSQSRADGSSGPQRRKVWLIEGGYTSDTRHLEKLAEKKNQRQKLVGALELRGFDVKPIIFAFGVGGTIYKQAVEDLHQPGVSTMAITTPSKEAHLHSVKCATNIIIQRRVLDSQKLLRTQRQPP